MNPQPSFNQHLASWKWAVSGKKAGTWPQEIMAASFDEFENWQRQLAQAKIDANNHGYPCQFNKGSKSGRCAAWVVANGHTLKIAYTSAKTTRPQKVTATSREAYHTTDFTTQRGQIASIIFEYTVVKGMQDVTRKEIEVWQRLGSNQVTGRVNELLEMSEQLPFDFGGDKYRLVVTEARLSKCDGASDKKNEGLRWVKVSQSAIQNMAMHGELFG